MRSVPRISVRLHLTLAFLLTIAITWGLTALTFRYYLEQDIGRINREMTHGHQPGPLRVVGPLGRLTYPGPETSAASPSTGKAAGDAKASKAASPTGKGPLATPEFGPYGPPPFHHGPGLPPPIFQSIPALFLISVAVSLLAGWWLSRGFTRRLASLSDGARAFHHREFTHRIPVKGNDEFADVATTMNEMAGQVGAQIATLEEDARRRKQLLADVAHELRSPMATLEAMTAALQDGLAEEPQRRADALSFMRDSASRMRRLVNDLLEVARLDLREVPLLCGPVDLCDLARDAVDVHQTSAAKAGITLRPVESVRPVIVEADSLRLSQVLDNLIENAISYAGRGAEVQTRILADPPRIVVQDSGAGIAAQHLPFIFDPFYRADAARTPGGNHSGLGLRIARGLVEAHGGTLTLGSEEGHGTTATITFPCEAPANPE